MRYLLFTAIFFVASAYSQVKTDSLLAVYNNTDNDDLERVSAYYLTAHSLRYISPDSSLKMVDSVIIWAKKVDHEETLAKSLQLKGILMVNRGRNDEAMKLQKSSLKLYKKIKDKEGQTRSLINIGNLHKNVSDYEEAASYYLKSIEVSKEIDNPVLLTMGYNNLAELYFYRGDYAECIRLSMKALKIREEVNDIVGLATSYSNIGLIYYTSGDIKKAIEFLERGLELEIQLNNPKGISNNYHNIGAMYFELGDYNNALTIVQKAYEVDSARNDPYSISNIYVDLGSIHKHLGDLDKSMTYYKKAIELDEKHGYYQGLTVALYDLGELHIEMNQWSQAKPYLSRSFDLAKKHDYTDMLAQASKGLYKVYKTEGNMFKALEMYELHIQMRDSLESERNRKELIRQEMQYEYDKQAAADSIKAAEEAKVRNAQLAAEQAKNKQHKLEAQQQRQQKYYLYGGLVLALLFGGFTFNRFRVTSRQKNIIEEQKQKVDEAYDQLAEKNSEILDSINYAKRIQSAILPPTKVVKEYLQDSFILYKPKDIVAGDFYWLEHKDNQVLFAACDCTGHGVPGAMVSVVCNNGLNRAVREHGLTDPGKILDKTREIVIAEFQKSEEEVKDGMDVALCSLENNKLRFAGAHNPLWIIRNGTGLVEEVRADKQPIGKSENPIPYTTRELNLNPGDTLYIFSDGYADQFGGERGKKFKSANFKKLLLSIQRETMQTQRDLIDQAFENWKGDIEQLDDVCVIGVRI